MLWKRGHTTDLASEAELETSEGMGVPSVYGLHLFMLGGIRLAGEGKLTLT
jgi:hypothetical protein